MDPRRWHRRRDINVSGGALNIRAERRKEAEVTEKGYYHSELRYGAFGRPIPLPSGSDESHVKATYRDGILEVRIPVKKKTEAKIQVTRS
jgi:HSP20 family protein